MISRLNNLSVRWKIFLTVASLLLVYAISFGSSLILLSFLATGGNQVTFSLKSNTSQLVEKNTPCPINGVKYSDLDAEKWSQRRPLGVMVENHVTARPQTGLSKADVIYEAVAEGGITRFLAVYLCQDANDIAPVRSARTYFLDWISEYDGLYAHIGGANTPGPANALGQIRDYKIKDLDQFGLGFPTYWRSTDKPAPHNVHTSTEKLWEAAAKRGWNATDENGNSWDSNFKQWRFKDDVPLDLRPASGSAQVNFWSRQTDYSVTWKYDKASNSYLRYHNESAQIDNLTNEPISAKVVIIQFQEERTARDGYPGDVHLLYKTIGSGSALILQDGKLIKGRWSKPSRVERTLYFDESGNEIKFNRGQMWIQTVPIGADIIY